MSGVYSAQSLVEELQRYNPQTRNGWSCEAGPAEQVVKGDDVKLKGMEWQFLLRAFIAESAQTFYSCQIYIQYISRIYGEMRLWISFPLTSTT